MSATVLQANVCKLSLCEALVRTQLEQRLLALRQQNIDRLRLYDSWEG